jgi:hypothetical protein
MIMIPVSKEMKVQLLQTVDNSVDIFHICRAKHYTGLAHFHFNCRCKENNISLTGAKDALRP